MRRNRNIILAAVAIIILLLFALERYHSVKTSKVDTYTVESSAEDTDEQYSSEDLDTVEMTLICTVVLQPVLMGATLWFVNRKEL